MKLPELVRAFLKDLELSGKSKRTLEAYSFHLDKFVAFCREKRLDYWLIKFLIHRVELKASFQGF